MARTALEVEATLPDIEAHSQNSNNLGEVPLESQGTYPCREEQPESICALLGGGGTSQRCPRKHMEVSQDQLLHMLLEYFI